MSRTQHARAPRRACRECGRRVYSFNPSPLCGACVAVLRQPQPESLRDFRKRAIEQ